MRFLLAAAVDGDLQELCGEQPSWVCEAAADLTGNNRVVTGLTDTLVSIVIIFAVATVLSVLARRFLGRAVTRMVASDGNVASRQIRRLDEKAPTMVPDALLPEGPDPRRTARATSISAVVKSTSTVLIWTIAVITALGEVNIDLGPLIASAGIAGVALGFGAQTLVKDCIAGFFMLVEDQYGIGDVVDLDEAGGTVEKISLRTTVLRGIDGTVWHVPNGEVSRVGNRSQLWSVALVDIDVAYDADLATAREVISNCVETVCRSDEWSGDVVEDPKLLGVEALGADGITIRATVKTQPGTQWALQRALREALKAALDGAGIEIPFPQRTVWMRTEGSADAPGPDNPSDEPPPTSH